MEPRIQIYDRHRHDWTRRTHLTLVGHHVPQPLVVDQAYKQRCQPACLGLRIPNGANLSWALTVGWALPSLKQKNSVCFDTVLKKLNHSTLLKSLWPTQFQEIFFFPVCLLARVESRCTMYNTYFVMDMVP